MGLAIRQIFDLVGKRVVPLAEIQISQKPIWQGLMAQIKIIVSADPMEHAIEPISACVRSVSYRGKIWRPCYSEFTEIN